MSNYYSRTAERELRTLRYYAKHQNALNKHMDKVAAALVARTVAANEEAALVAEAARMQAEYSATLYGEDDATRAAKVMLPFAMSIIRAKLSAIRAERP